MRRLACTLVLALAIVLFWPASAQAKAPTQAVITGPGVDRPITVASDGVEVWGPADPVKRLCETTGFCAAAGFSEGGAITDPAADPPAGALGAAYVVEFVDWGTATVYPFARGGPWAEISGQVTGEAGWVKADKGVLPLLRELGVSLAKPAASPPPPPAAAPAPDPVPEPAPASAVTPGIVTAGVVAIVLAPLAILLLRRRRRLA